MSARDRWNARVNGAPIPSKPVAKTPLPAANGRPSKPPVDAPRRWRDMTREERRCSRLVQDPGLAYHLAMEQDAKYTADMAESGEWEQQRIARAEAQAYLWAEYLRMEAEAQAYLIAHTELMDEFEEDPDEIPERSSLMPEGLKQQERATNPDERPEARKQADGEFWALIESAYGDVQEAY